MYIFTTFGPLCMHCQKTTTIRCFLRPLTTFLVVFRKPWIYTLCFDAHFSKFRDFWWFWTILIEKWTFGPLLRDLKQPPVQKSRYICLLPMGPSQNLLKPLKTPILTILTLWGSREVGILTQKIALFDLPCEMTRNGWNMRKPLEDPF